MVALVGCSSDYIKNPVGNCTSSVSPSCDCWQNKKRALNTVGFALFLESQKLSKTVGKQAFSEKRAGADSPGDRKMNGKRSGFSISSLLQSRRVVENSLKTSRFTALSARLQVAVGDKIKNERKTLWVFHFLMVALAARSTESLKILGETALPACHQVTTSDKMKNEA